MRLIKLALVIFGGTTLFWPQAVQLKTTDAVLEKYQQALGGVDAIKKVQSLTARGEVESTGMQGKATFVYYAKPFKTLLKVTRPDGNEIISGFDGSTSWSITPKEPSIDTDTALEAVRRDADLQYPLHSQTISKNLNSRASPISKAGPAIGFTAPPIGARTTISSMMSRPACSRVTVFNPTIHPPAHRSPCSRSTRISAVR